MMIQKTVHYKNRQEKKINRTKYYINWNKVLVKIN